MWTVETIRVFLDDLWTRFRAHVSNASAHHAPYTDAEVDVILAVHTAIINAHHDKYTDAAAVAAVDVSDKFVERNVVNAVTGSTGLERASLGEILSLKTTVAGAVMLSESMILIGKSTDTSTVNMYVDLKFPYFKAEGTDGLKGLGYIQITKAIGSQMAVFNMKVANAAGALRTAFKADHEKIDLANNYIKDCLNEADGTLSGTPKLFIMYDGSTKYYIRGYPTKT